MNNLLLELLIAIAFSWVLIKFLDAVREIRYEQWKARRDRLSPIEYREMLERMYFEAKMNGEYYE